MTIALFEDCFINHFVSSVEWHCTKKCISYKVLDNVPGHSTQLGDFHHIVKVVYLSPKTMALLKPIEQV